VTAFSVGTAHERLNPLEQQQQYLDAPVIYAEFSDRAKMPVAQFGFANRMEIEQVFLDLQNTILNCRRDLVIAHEERQVEMRVRYV
jgi:hypothetical protein